MKASTAKLDASEIRRAIYVDYEGNENRPPTLLGWRVERVHFGAIVEPLFATCADRYRAPGNHYQAHGALIQSLISKAERDDRRIVSWSEHDWREMMAALDDTEWQARLCVVYRNAIKTARPWYRQHFGQTPPGATLGHFLERTGKPHPSKYGQGLVGTALRVVRQQLEAGEDYAGLTPRARASWVTVVKHNQLDLVGMEHVMQATTQPWFDVTAAAANGKPRAPRTGKQKPARRAPEASKPKRAA